MTDGKMTPDAYAEALAIQLHLVGVTWDELLDAQLAIEGTTTERAAERATGEDIAELHRLLEACERTVDDPKVFTELSIRFHQRIAEAAGNRALRVALKSLGKLQAAEYTPRTSPEVAKSVVATHRGILEKIEAGDGPGARALMSDHLSTVNRRARSETQPAPPVEIDTVDPTLFKAAARRFATGVTIVTTSDEHEVYGMTVSAFASLSLDPLLVLVSLNNYSPLPDMIDRSQRFAISILREGQEDIAAFFATPERPRYENAFPDIDCVTDVTGAPIIKGALAHFDCRLHTVLPGGDHKIVMGTVVGASEVDGAPMLYYDGSFRSLDHDDHQ